jgi:uncharacterized membrane protein
VIALALCVAGWAAIVYGAWMVYPPAGLLVAGLLLLAAGVLYTRGVRMGA